MASIVTIVDSSGSYQPTQSHGPFAYGSYLYVVCTDGLTGQTLIFRSSDSGATWSLIDDTGPLVRFFPSSGIPARMGVCLDGSLIRCAFLPETGVSTCEVTHQAFSLEAFTWSTASASGEVIEPAAGIEGCLWTAGGIFTAVPKVFTSGSTAFLTVVQVFDGSTWGSAQTIAQDDPFSAPSYCCPSAAGGVHLGFVYIGQYYVHFDSSETFGTVYSAFNGNSALAFTYNGTEYLCVAFISSPSMRCSISAIADPSTWTTKTIYTRDAGTELAIGASYALVRSGGSLHCLFWWVQSDSSQKLRKSCLPFTNSAADWSTPEQIATQSSSDSSSSYMTGDITSGQARMVYAPRIPSSSNYVRYLTESLASCSCCCSNFAY